MPSLVVARYPPPGASRERVVSLPPSIWLASYLTVFACWRQGAQAGARLSRFLWGITMTIFRSFTVVLAAVFASALLTVPTAAGAVESGSAATSPSWRSVADSRAGCGAAVPEVWYDQDQYGSYHKVMVKTPPGCRGVPVTISGNFYCHGGPIAPKHLGVVNDAGVAPFSTDILTLPSKSKCTKFFAETTATYENTAGGQVDVWQWEYGNYPA